jgi:hypothetical protein
MAVTLQSFGGGNFSGSIEVSGASLPGVIDFGSSYSAVLGSLTLASTSMLFGYWVGYPAPNNPYVAPTSVTFGGNACTVACHASGFSLGSGQPDRELVMWFCPLTSGTTFSDYKLRITWPGSVTSIFGLAGEIACAYGVDATATALLTGAEAVITLGNNVNPDQCTFPSSISAAVGDMIMTVSGAYNWAYSAAAPVVSTPSGYTNTTGGFVLTSGQVYAMASKPVSVATADTISWQYYRATSSGAWAATAFVLKAPLAPPPVVNPSFIAPITYFVKPDNVPFVVWAAKMNSALNAREGALIVSDEKNWKTWASRIVTLSSINYLTPPSPLNYTDWRAWARDFIRTLSLSGL